MTGRRILIVEDDPVTAESLAEVLRLSGAAAADWAANGEAALTKMAPPSRYDAAVIDYYLPALDGLATLRRMRAAGVTTPAVLVTAAASWDVQEMRERLGGLGPACVLRKPFAVAELAAEIRRLEAP